VEMAIYQVKHVKRWVAVLLSNGLNWPLHAMIDCMEIAWNPVVAVARDAA
jgi:hypothetical protein